MSYRLKDEKIWLTRSEAHCNRGELGPRSGRAFQQSGWTKKKRFEPKPEIAPTTPASTVPNQDPQEREQIL